MKNLRDILKASIEGGKTAIPTSNKLDAVETFINDIKNPNPPKTPPSFLIDGAYKLDKLGR